MSTKRHSELSRPMTRRAAAGLAGTGLLAACACTLAGCSDSPDATTAQAEAPAAEAGLPELPKADPDPEDQFQVDRNINMNTIDDWLGRPDVAYRDMRMLRDPAYYEEIGGSATLDYMLEGFKAIPYPYIGTLQQLPVQGAYTGPTLFDVEWDEGGEVVSATPNYEQSQLILDEVFPKDRPVFLMCGGAGYANMTRRLLIHLGWDPDLLYNVGGAWSYTGYNLIELTHRNPDGTMEFFSWRADTVPIQFDEFTPVS